MPNFFTVRGVSDELKEEFKITCLKRKEPIGSVVANLMIEHIAMAGLETRFWPGYRRIAWSSCKAGQEVWIAGAVEGRPSAYGPHTIVDPQKRLLRNQAGTTFFQHQDILLRR